MMFLCSQDGSAATPMQRLCLLKIVRPDSLVSAIQQYVTASLGPQIAEPALVSLVSLKKESNNTTPIIFILSSGSPLHMQAFYMGSKLRPSILCKQQYCLHSNNTTPIFAILSPDLPLHTLALNV